MELIGPCDLCGKQAEWWLETHQFGVSLNHGVTPGQLVEKVPICDECMTDMLEDEDGHEENNDASL